MMVTQMLSQLQWKWDNQTEQFIFLDKTDFDKVFLCRHNVKLEKKVKPHIAENRNNALHRDNIVS